MATTTLRTSPEVCGMGHSMKRKEDPRFIRGQGNYIDDIVLPGESLAKYRNKPAAAAPAPAGSRCRRQSGEPKGRRRPVDVR